MSQGILDSVDSRTQLAGQNRFEMLKFVVGGQSYGINVFKVREVVRDAGSISEMPGAHEFTIGAASLRGDAITVIDLGKILKGRSTTKVGEGVLMVTEYNTSVQAFLVDSVLGIENVTWSSISPPPSGAKSSYLTGVCRIQDSELVMLPDVEQILSEINPPVEVADATLTRDIKVTSSRNTALIVDDSAVARKQIQRALENLDIDIVLAKNGREGLEKARQLEQSKCLAFILSDIEMPEMDGYTLTAECRADENLKHSKIILHSSLSGVFNQALVQKVGADVFVAKFAPDKLVKVVSEFLN